MLKVTVMRLTIIFVSLAASHVHFLEEKKKVFLHLTGKTYVKLWKLQKDANVLTVVGKTFDDLVLRSPKNILLEVCIFCFP